MASWYNSSPSPLDLIITVFLSVMLAEGVVAKQDVVPGQIGEHAVGPMQHPGFYEDQLPLSQRQPVLGFDRHKVPLLKIMTFEGPSRWPCSKWAYQGLISSVPARPPAMIDLRMVGDDVIIRFKSIAWDKFSINSAAKGCQTVSINAFFRISCD